MGNENLCLAKSVKNDEFYTRLTDIEHSLYDFRKHFIGKTILCNCDDPFKSNFFHYFGYLFEVMKLKRLITTCYKSKDASDFSSKDSGRAVWLEYTGDKNGNKIPDPEEIGVHEFEGDGDFRSPECIELLKQADIVCTNPPFSLFREYIYQLMEYKKKFIVIGSKNAFTYKEIFPLIQSNKIWTGVYEPKEFIQPDGSTRKFGNICWFTNLDISKRHIDYPIFKQYDPKLYPKYDNYDAINVDRVKDIPIDYYGAMGVPITFIDVYNPAQFEILDARNYTSIERLKNKQYGLIKDADGSINGKAKYARILIRRRPEAVKKAA